MTIIEAIKKTHGRIRRKGKIDLLPSGNIFYYYSSTVNKEQVYWERYTLSIEDILATDWEYMENNWVSK